MQSLSEPGDMSTWAKICLDADEIPGWAQVWEPSFAGSGLRTVKAELEFYIQY